jgi:hypothetical protein
VIAIQKSLLASMVVQAGRARKPLEHQGGRLSTQRYKHVHAVVDYQSLKKFVCEMNNREEFSKPTVSALYRGASYHSSTIGMVWTRVKIECDENGLV